MTSDNHAAYKARWDRDEPFHRHTRPDQCNPPCPDTEHHHQRVIAINAAKTAPPTAQQIAQRKARQDYERWKKTEDKWRDWWHNNTEPLHIAQLAIIDASRLMHTANPYAAAIHLRKLADIIEHHVDLQYGERPPLGRHHPALAHTRTAPRKAA